MQTFALLFALYFCCLAFQQSAPWTCVAQNVIVAVCMQRQLMSQAESICIRLLYMCKFPVVATVESLAWLVNLSSHSFGGHLQQGDELVVSQIITLFPLTFRCIGKVVYAMQMTMCQMLDTPSVS